MAESNDMLGQGCGCTIRNHGRVIEYCPMHAAAPEMLAALEKVIIRQASFPLGAHEARIVQEAIAQARLGQEDDDRMAARGQEAK